MDTLQEAVYQSQVGNPESNDCGAAEVLGFAQTYKRALDKTVSDVYQEILPGGKTGLTLNQLQRWLAGNGILGSWNIIDAPEKLYAPLYTRKPVIFLIHYGTWVEKHLTQFTNFIGGHFITTVGIDLLSVYVHDPDHSDGLGTFQPIPISAFFQSLKDCYKDIDSNGFHNPSYMGFIPSLPIQDLSNHPVPGPNSFIIVATNGANIRSAGVETNNIIGYLPKGAMISVVKYNPMGFCKFTNEKWPNGAYIWGPFLVPTP